MYEMEVNGVAVMRRRKDSWLNATQILKVAGIDKGKRTKVLEKEILIGDHEKVQGGYGKYQGTWIRFDRGLEFCRQYGVEELLMPLLTYDMGQDGGVAGRGGIDTPTKEQAMAAQRKRLYNGGNETRTTGPSGTFFKNISHTASHAVAAISKARFDSPAPRLRTNGGHQARPGSFSRQTSQQFESQESAFPGNSQQSMQSFASEDSFARDNHDSAYATHSASHSGPYYSHNGLNSSHNEMQEPPRKRMRPSPAEQHPTHVLTAQQQLQQRQHEQQLQHDYDISMREVSPTEPNDSFMYNPNQNVSMSQSQSPADDSPAALPPLSLTSISDSEAKRGLLMSLFIDPARTDFADHPALHSIPASELDMPIDNTSHTALHWAATLARLPLLRVLISRGANINRVNSGGETALMRTCVATNNYDTNTFPEVVELLAQSIETRDKRGRSVLHHIALTSAVKGRSQSSKYYLETLLEHVVRQGSNSAPNSQDATLHTSDEVGASQSSSQAKALNIGRFMRHVVNARDNAGDTALNIAARIGNRSIISQLLEVGADASIANHAGLRPVDFGIGEPAEGRARMDLSVNGSAGGGKDEGDRRVGQGGSGGGSGLKENSGEIISCELILFLCSLVFPHITPFNPLPSYTSTFSLPLCALHSRSLSTLCTNSRPLFFSAVPRLTSAKP